MVKLFLVIFNFYIFSEKYNIKKILEFLHNMDINISSQQTSSNIYIIVSCNFPLSNITVTCYVTVT